MVKSVKERSYILFWIHIMAFIVQQDTDDARKTEKSISELNRGRNLSSMILAEGVATVGVFLYWLHKVQTRLVLQTKHKFRKFEMYTTTFWDNWGCNG